MPLDAVCLRAVMGELESELIGARVDKIHQPERDEIILVLRGERNRKLLISAGAADARMHFTNSDYENPPAPPMFCMLLRKHLSGARIVSVVQPPAERVVLLTFSGYDTLGNVSSKQLAVELMGRNANLALIDDDGVILDCLRRVDTDASDKRPVLPGLIYRLPTARGLLDPMALSLEEWTAAVRAAPAELPVEKWLLDTFSGLSPLVSREIANRAYGDASALIGTEREALARTAFELLDAPPEPWLLAEQSGKPRDFSYTQIAQYDDKYAVSRLGSFSELLESFYTARARDERNRARASALTRTIKTTRERTLRRIAAQREELAAAGDRERFRENGDIIMANLHTLKRGDRLLRAQDFYVGEDAVREIPLDVWKNPQQNAAKYYKDYSKAKNAEQVLGGRIAQGELEADYLASILAILQLAPGERELEELRGELANAGFIKKEAKRAKRGKPLPPRGYKTASGMEILVGRNNVQNEELTFKTAFKTDLWLHVKDLHGSHVILRTGGATPSAEDVTDAAALAAYYSEARDEGRALVDYCPAKYVKKQPGGRPGMVLYTDYKTVAVAPHDGAV